MPGTALSVVTKRVTHKKDKALQVRVDPELRHRIERVVSETGQTFSEAIRQLLVAGLDLHEGKRKN